MDLCYHDVRRFDDKLDALNAKLDTLILALTNDEALRELTKDVQHRAAALRDALPASNAP